MARVMVALTLFAATAMAADVRGASWRSSLRGVLSVAGTMQPEAVARTLAKVEEQWQAQALQFNECNSTAAGPEDAEKCAEPANAFQKSCSTVAEAVVKASNGDRAVVGEYMADVCGQPELQGRQRVRCQLLGTFLAQGMDDDSYTNRENLNAAKLCQGFWLRVAFEETKQGQQELAAKAQADEATKAAKEAAEAAKKASQEAQVEEKENLQKTKQTIATEAAEASKDEKEADVDVKAADSEEEDAKKLLAEVKDEEAAGTKAVNKTSKAKF